MFLGAFLVTALLFGLLGLGRPNVAVAITLDLSGSTYSNSPQLFNAPNTVMAQEIAAVQSYLEQNSQMLKIPNRIQIFGFAGEVLPLTSSFKTDKKQLEAELKQVMQNPQLPFQVGEGTNINQAIQKGTAALSSFQDSCRELLLVTDGQADISPLVVVQAATQRVKINAIVVGGDIPALKLAAFSTKGIYLNGKQNNLKELFIDKLFTSFNSNLKWIIFWLAAAWISFMWMLSLPLDRWIFQKLGNLPPNISGQLALGNAFFWSVITPIIVWKLFYFSFSLSC
ncbi:MULTISPECIES: VWA domain-containing protein [unclassified Nostoc]|uniref:vWA domain-containing protein n=1 Tax=unclassified Nostoc TaxID=2593658 RepID=UPI001C88E781|nr:MULTISPECIES: vWA domain-containing protein [unclassified Nostoc]